MTISRQLPLIVSGVAIAVAIFAAVSQCDRPSTKGAASAEGARLEDMQAQVASIVARLEKLEDRLAAAGATSGQSSVAQSSQSVRDEVRVYGSDARLPLGSDLVVSSPTGVMVSDHAQRTIVGDVTIESPTAIIETTEAVVDATSGGAHVHAKTLSLVPRKSEEKK